MVSRGVTMSAKELAGSLNRLGTCSVHFTAVMLDRELRHDYVASAYEGVVKFCFGYDYLLPEGFREAISRVREQMTDGSISMSDKVVDPMVTFICARKLAEIHEIDDLSLADLWQPEPKRFRRILACMLNFCRFLVAQQERSESTKAEKTMPALEREIKAAVKRNEEWQDKVLNIERRYKESLPRLQAAQDGKLNVENSIVRMQEKLSKAIAEKEKLDETIAARQEAHKSDEEKYSQCKEDVAYLTELQKRKESLDLQLQEMDDVFERHQSAYQAKLEEKQKLVALTKVSHDLKELMVGYQQKLMSLHDDHPDIIALERSKASAQADRNKAEGLRRRHEAMINKVYDLRVLEENLEDDLEHAKERQTFLKEQAAERQAQQDTDSEPPERQEISELQLLKSRTGQQHRGLLRA